MYVTVHSHSYLDFLHIYNVLVIGREIALPVWLVDVLINVSSLLFFVVGIELLVRINLYFFVYEIVGIENNIAVIVGILCLLYCLFLTLSIYADNLV